jgi:hypothetical protein
MQEAIANKEERKRLSVMLISPILLIGGIILNIGFEHHNPLKLWENSPYPISWADLFYPPLCVFLCLTGLVLMIDGVLHANTTWRALAYSAAIQSPSLSSTPFSCMQCSLSQPGQIALASVRGSMRRLQVRT